MLLLWLKAFHVFFVICWFAGLFYLPRLFVHHAMSEDAATRERLTIMEGKLYRFVTPLAALAVILGLAMIWVVPSYLSVGWMHAKLALVVALIGYHHVCGRLVRGLREGTDTHSHRWFRVFNELPVLILLPVVILVVVKPF
jgi:putative membrane protein